MEHLTFHEYSIPIRGVKPKILYHFSDVHLNPTDDLSSPDERQGAETNTAFWRDMRRGFAANYGEPYNEERVIEATDYFERMMNTVQKDGDALVIAGDLFDSISGAVIREYETLFSHLKVPHLFVRGNHEVNPPIPDGCAMARIKEPVQILDLDDVIIAGFDNAENAVTREHITALDALLNQPKPLILAMHIPIQVDHNEIHKQCPDYYRLNYNGAPCENFAFVDRILQNSCKIAAVLAGHLHFLNTCELVSGLPQYVSSQGILGHINHYVIGE
jgi:DNA repair exonuclease SbcCD nuclease subunit